VHGRAGQSHQRVVRLAFRATGERSVYLERLSRDLTGIEPIDHAAASPAADIVGLLNGVASKSLHRELVHGGLLPEGASYAARVLGCVAVC